eukprot:1159669-Pelagomonas_calceolata.AAC.2
MPTLWPTVQNTPHPVTQKMACNGERQEILLSAAAGCKSTETGMAAAGAAGGVSGGSQACLQQGGGMEGKHVEGVSTAAVGEVQGCEVAWTPSQLVVFRCLVSSSTPERFAGVGVFGFIQHSGVFDLFQHCRWFAGVRQQHMLIIHHSSMVSIRAFAHVHSWQVLLLCKAYTYCAWLTCPTVVHGYFCAWLTCPTVQGYCFAWLTCPTVVRGHCCAWLTCPASVHVPLLCVAGNPYNCALLKLCMADKPYCAECTSSI